MTGKSMPGVRGFVNASGAPLDDEVHLRINSEVLASLESLRKHKESTPDVIRRAVNQYVEKELGKRAAILNGGSKDV